MFCDDFLAVKMIWIDYIDTCFYFIQRARKQGNQSKSFSLLKNRHKTLIKVFFLKIRQSLPVRLKFGRLEYYSAFTAHLQLSELTSMYDDIQDRIWEIEKSWRNNLMFHGIRYDDPSVEEDPNRTEEKIRTVIRVDLQLSRDIPILRAHRIRNGPLVKGTHPILGKLP